VSGSRPSSRSKADAGGGLWPLLDGHGVPVAAGIWGRRGLGGGADLSEYILVLSQKPGKWCAVHVQIAWQIYHHQQKMKVRPGQVAHGQEGSQVGLIWEDSRVRSKATVRGM
jgi:hypothetical protein